MTDFAALPHDLDDTGPTCRAVIEASRGTRSKYGWEPRLGVFALSGLLPEGMSYPFDFGFVPSTRAEDGDPLDIMVLGDEPTPPGMTLTARLVGVIEGRQTEQGGKAVRNDRVLAVTAQSRLLERVRGAADLGDAVIETISAFWVNDNALKNKRFEVLAVRPVRHAVALVRRLSLSPLQATHRKAS